MKTTDIQTRESGRAFGKTATAFRAATGKRLRMHMAPKTYTIHRGTVRSSFALATHRLGIYERQDRARLALSDANVDLDHAKQVCTLVGDAHVSLVPDERRIKFHEAIVASAQTELRNASARADEARKMHLVPFVPPYVPAKASRVYPALKTCTSPRRAAKARQRAVVASFCSYQSTPADYPGVAGAYAETSLGYTAR